MPHNALIIMSEILIVGSKPEICNGEPVGGAHGLDQKEGPSSDQPTSGDDV